LDIAQRYAKVRKGEGLDRFANPWFKSLFATLPTNFNPFDFAYLCVPLRDADLLGIEARLLFDDVPGAWFALLDVAGRGNRYERAALKRGGLAERDIGHLARLALEWKVFA
jgi:hypothetical protein